MDSDKSALAVTHTEEVLHHPVEPTNRNLDDKKAATHHTEEVLHTLDSTDIKIDNIVALVQDESSQKYSPWTPSMWRLYGVLLVAYLCGCLNGYDGSLMGGINAMDSYQATFKL